MKNFKYEPICIKSCSKMETTKGPNNNPIIYATTSSGGTWSPWI